MYRVGKRPLSLRARANGPAGRPRTSVDSAVAVAGAVAWEPCHMPVPSLESTHPVLAGTLPGLAIRRWPAAPLFHAAPGVLPEPLAADRTVARGQLTVPPRGFAREWHRY